MHVAKKMLLGSRFQLKPSRRQRWLLNRPEKKIACSLWYPKKVPMLSESEQNRTFWFWIWWLQSSIDRRGKGNFNRARDFGHATKGCQCLSIFWKRRRAREDNDSSENLSGSLVDIVHVFYTMHYGMLDILFIVCLFAEGSRLGELSETTWIVLKDVAIVSPRFPWYIHLVLIMGNALLLCNEPSLCRHLADQSICTNDAENRNGRNAQS